MSMILRNGWPKGHGTLAPYQVTFSCHISQFGEAAVIRWRDDCLHRLGALSGSMPDMVSELGSIVQELGFEYCSYVLKTPLLSANDPELAWASTYPGAWLERYFSQGYLEIDPLVRAPLRGHAPLVWSAAAREDCGEFWEEADAHGVRHGWALTTYGRGGTSGVLSLARSGSPLTADELNAREMQLMWLGQTVQGLLSAAHQQRHLPGPSCELTSREREVLRWTAAGKTADEIGIILGITARTVNFHITRCVSKLDVVNKTQAIAKAMLFDMLY